MESAFNEPMNEQVVRDFVQQFHPNFPVGWNTRVAVYAAAQYSILSQKPFYVPHLLFIDRQWTVRLDVPGEDPFMQNPGQNIRRELDKLLTSPAAGAKKAAPHKK